MTASPLRPGDPRQLGDYRLVARLGEGGMGSVFLAEPPSGGRVAIKVIRPDLSSDEGFRARFRSEVKRAQQVPPFCTAEVLDAAPDHDPPFLVVEYVDGPSLAEIVHEHGPLSGSQLHSVAIGVTTALAAIHDAGIVHRDLKPANVLLAPLTSPKVIDFGIAKALHTTEQHTEPGLFLGTVAYMGPERFNASSADEVGTAADIFAWGAVVMYAATGRTPYTHDALIATAVGLPLPAPDLGTLPRPLRGLVARSLDADPARRPTAHDLLDELIRAGAAGHPTIRESLRAQPDLRRAAAAARHTVAIPAPVRPGRATLEQPGRAWPRRLPLKTVATVAAAALVAGFAAYPATNRLVPSHAPATSTALPSVANRATSEEKASRANRKERCTLEGPVEVTSRRPHAFDCPVGTTTGDRTVKAQFKILSPGTCAAISTTVTSDDSYRVSVCADHVTLTGDHRGRTRTIEYTALETPLELGSRHRIEIATPGPGITVTLDGQQHIGRARLTPRPDHGAVILGAVPEPGRTAAGVVSYADAAIAF